MVRLGATIASSFALISCAVVAASGASQCPQEAGLALIQTRSLHSKVTLAPASPIKSGDGIFLQVARTGKRLTAQEDGVLHAKWASTGTWEKFLIERKSGDGNVQSGDTIFLTAWTGNRFTVGDWQSGDLVATTVHAKWDDKGEWQTLSIVKEGAEGPIMDGDKIFLKSWTGAIVDSDAPDTAAGAVQARWDHMGSWQELVVEASDLEMGPAPAPPQQEPSPVCDPRKEEAGCPTGMECCDDGSGSPTYPGTTGRCYDPSTHVCFGGNYGNQVKHGICEIGMNSCLGKCYDGPDELCCKGGSMNQGSFVLSNASMTCCNGLDGHYECAPGAKCMKEGYKAWCEAAAPEQPKDPLQCRYTRGKPCTEQKDCGVGCGSCEGGHCVVPDKGFCGRPCTTLTEEQDCGGIGTNTCSYCDGYFCTR